MNRVQWHQLANERLRDTTVRTLLDSPKEVGEKGISEGAERHRPARCLADGCEQTLAKALLLSLNPGLILLLDKPGQGVLAVGLGEELVLELHDLVIHQ